jgi:hypothetical protein
VTYDVVALLNEPPTEEVVLAAMAATADAARDVGVRVGADGTLLRLHDDQDRLLVSIEDPYPVHVPLEVERLLGPEVPARLDVPICWVDIRAQELDGADRIARAFAEQLVRLVGGAVWRGGRPRSEDLRPWNAEA